MTRFLRYLWIVGGAIMGILLFLLASASANTDFFDRHYSWLLILNILVALALLIAVVWMLYRLYNRYKKGRFGSRLTTRLVVLFALMGIIPGAVIYGVSVSFVSRSIESWFDVRVEAALDSGVKLAQSILDSSKNTLMAQTQQLAKEINGKSLAEQKNRIIKFSRSLNDASALIVSKDGRLITSSTTPQNTSALLPTSWMLEQSSSLAPFAIVEGEVDDLATADKQESDITIRVVIPVVDAAGRKIYLQVIETLPENIINNAESLRAAYSEYQIRSLSRTGLKKIYIVTLSLTLLLAVFAAIASSFQIAFSLARPLLLLAQGTKAVAEGNLSPRPIVGTSDELGTLTQSFNTMTLQLAESRAALENAKGYLESVLKNMSAGVIVLNQAFHLVSFNDTAARILRTDLNIYLNTNFAQSQNIQAFAQAITNAFSELAAQKAAGDATTNLHWQQQIEININQSDVTLLARGTAYTANNENRYIVVFDDISEVISAQRSSAWGEVARRLAHEIKNPLTPIQLSAERLVMKLSDKLPENEANILKRSTDTIVNQVTAMKRMVNDFRDFAKIPPVVLKPLNLNLLIEDILHLYSDSEEASGIHPHLDASLPLILGDETQLRQVIHNLLQNSQDAISELAEENIKPAIDISTEIVMYQDANGSHKQAVQLTIIDNGPGFKDTILSRIFEPYITSKKTGTGLGMAMVKKIIDEHTGRIDVQNRIDARGARVAILFLKLALQES